MKFLRGRGRTRRIPGTMNRAEARYAQHLEARRLAGEVVWFKYESVTIKLAPDCRWTADFAVMLADGLVELHDFKGFMEAHTAIKIKIAADTFPFPVVVITERKGVYTFKRYE